MLYFMLNLPPQAIQELRSIYKKEFGIKMTDDEALTEARRLLNFFYDLFRYLQEQEQKKKHDIGRQQKLF